MATGTNYKGGISHRKKYSGNVDSTNNYERRAKTKFVRKTAVIRAKSPSGSEETTGVTLKAPFIVRDVYVDVKTAASSHLWTVGGAAASGAGDDPDGLVASFEMNVTGLRRAEAATTTTGLNETYLSAIGSAVALKVPRGVLLATLVAGSDVTTDVGTAVEHPYIGAVDMPVTITCDTANSGAVGDIIIVYDEVVQEDK